MRTMNLTNFLIPQRFYRCCSALKSGIVGSNVRSYSASADDSLPPAEKMRQILEKRFPKAKKIEVHDISGGCGSMFEITVETIEFKGLSLVKQHMLINQTLKDQIKSMHGLTVTTKIPEGS